MRDITHGLCFTQFPSHYIEFGLFDSRRFGLNLHERTGDTPSENEITTSIPYMQGVVDMSNLLGNRIYDNRAITYIFYRFGVNRKGTARDFQTTITNLLMREFDQRLDDSFEPDFFYQGKCQEVVVVDDYDRNRLRIEITFDLYPFKIAKHTEGDDLFDPFNFDIDAFHDGLSFAVTNQPTTIRLYNASQLVLRPLVTASATIELTREGKAPVQIHPGTGITYNNFRLEQGMNTLTLRGITGMATISFDWRKERI